jgi:hypothetical protein
LSSVKRGPRGTVEPFTDRILTPRHSIIESQRKAPPKPTMIVPADGK